MSNKKLQVNICGIPFRIKLEKTTNFNDSTLGEVVVKDTEIRIKDEMSPEMKHSVLIHEWLHAVLLMNHFYDEGSDEKLIDCLKNALYMANFRVPVQVLNEQRTETKSSKSN